MNTSRREVLKTSSIAGAAALAASLIPAVHAAEDNTIKMALVGCGGRGTGACGQALSVTGPTKLVAMADVFEDRLNGSLAQIAKQHPDKIDVPQERKFIGLDAYKKAVEAVGKGGVVLLTTPPAFRPWHLEWAVQEGRHVFMEKSFGTDSPGVRRVLAAGELARQKNLKIAGGLMWRHELGRQALIEKCHKGELGDLLLLKPYRMHGPVGFRPKQPGESEVAHQIRNYNAFTWLNGSFLLDWLIHDIDVCCWAKGKLPIAAQGHGGRQQRKDKDQQFDHFAVEYFFDDGTELLAQGRHMDQVYNLYSIFMHGTKGSAIIEQAVSPDGRIRTYKNQVMTKENETWRYDGPNPNPYQREHDLLFEAIRKDLPYNETERCAKAALCSILGRMAVESGQRVTWDQAMNSEVSITGDLAKLTMDGPAPVMPDAEGNYPIAVPGKTKAF